MVLGTMTQQSEKGAQTLEPRFKAHMQFLGDSSYTTGGTTGFAALVAAAAGRAALEVISVTKVGLCGGFIPVYDPIVDSLLVLRSAGINAAQEEVPNAANLSGTTFDVLVEYK